jgi:hypothetical protein
MLPSFCPEDESVENLNKYVCVMYAQFCNQRFKYLVDIANAEICFDKKRQVEICLDKPMKNQRYELILEVNLNMI